MNDRYIITGDWQLRQHKPRCRLDKDWIETQKRIIQFVYDKAVELKADIIHTGDLFHYSQVSDLIKNIFLSIALSAKDVVTYMIAGNHDLYYHSWNQIEKSSFGVIWNMIKAEHPILRDFSEIGAAFPYGIKLKGTGKYYTAIHTLTFEKTVPKFMGGITAKELLKKFKDANFIFTGDNHRSFFYEDNGRCVINPGCLFRDEADLKNYQCKIFLFDENEDGFGEWIYVPDDEELVTDEYLTEEKEKDEKIEAFVSCFEKGDSEITFSFEDDLLNAAEKNKDKFDDGVIEFIYEVLQEVNND